MVISVSSVFISSWLHNIPSYLYSPQCTGGTPGKVLLGPGDVVCIRIKTLNQRGADGYLTANIDIGDEVQNIVRGNMYWPENSDVTSRCYKHVVEIKVSGSSNNAWSGYFQYSVSNSIDYLHLTIFMIFSLIKMCLSPSWTKVPPGRIWYVWIVIVLR